jgi:hypothetical protein
MSLKVTRTNGWLVRRCRERPPDAGREAACGHCPSIRPCHDECVSSLPDGEAREHSGHADDRRWPLGGTVGSPRVASRTLNRAGALVRPFLKRD